jgi:hypothetical protein
VFKHSLASSIGATGKKYAIISLGPIHSAGIKYLSIFEQFISESEQWLRALLSAFGIFFQMLGMKEEHG